MVRFLTGSDDQPVRGREGVEESCDVCRSRRRSRPVPIEFIPRRVATRGTLNRRQSRVISLRVVRMFGPAAGGFETRRVENGCGWGLLPPHRSSPGAVAAKATVHRQLRGSLRIVYRSYARSTSSGASSKRPRRPGWRALGSGCGIQRSRPDPVLWTMSDHCAVRRGLSWCPRRGSRLRCA